MERAWFVADESNDRPGYICLAIRETESGRLIADLADYPDDVPDFVQRVKEEASILAHSRELFDTLEELLESVQNPGDARYCKAISQACDLMDKVKGK